MGQSPKSSLYNEDGKGLPFYQGKAEFGANYPSPVKWCSKPGKIAEKGDVLISVRAPVGPTNICQERSCIGRGLAAVRPLGGMQTQYLRYWLSIKQRELEAKATGTTFQAILGETLRSLEINLPPLPEQKRIVAKIESLFSRLDSAKDSLIRVRAEIKRYRQAVLKWAFEGKLTESRIKYKDIVINGVRAELCDYWKVYRMGDLIKLQGGFAFKSKEFVLDGIPIVKIANVNVESIDWSDKSYIEKNRLGEFKNYQLKSGDILIAMTRPVIKSLNTVKVVVVRESDLPALLNQRVGRFILGKQVNNNYLKYYICTDFFKKRVILESSSSQQPNISSNNVENFDLVLPESMSKQLIVVQAIESRFERAKVLEDAVAQGLSQIERLKQSILKKAFEGNLVAPDPSDEPVEILLERIKKEKANLEAGLRMRIKRKNK